MKRISALLLAMLMIVGAFAGCGKDSAPSQPSADTDISDEPTTPDEPVTPDEPTASHTHVWDKGTISGNQKSYKCFVCGSTKSESYTAVKASADVFVQKNIFSADNYVKGILIEETGITSGNKYQVSFAEGSKNFAYILPVYLGNCYEVRFETSVTRLRVGYIKTNPYLMENGDVITYSDDNSIVYNKAVPSSREKCNFLYTPNEDGFLVIYTGTTKPTLYVGEQVIVTDTYSEGTYWIAPSQGSLNVSEAGAMGDRNWDSETFFNNMYEPVRAQYPEYITRTLLGKDQSEKYNMYAYIYTPEDYKTTFFIASGMHGSEIPSYFALAKIMELIANATPEDEQLYFLRTNVRFVIVPLINVWSASNTQIYENSTNTNLNRDFPNLTQKETQNVYAILKQYSEDIDFLIDFHCAGNTGSSSMYQHFAIQAENSHVIFRTINHLHHRQVELGYVKKLQAMNYVPGSYKKTTTTLQGRAYVEFGISSITVEHLLRTPGFPDGYSAKGMTWAVEQFANVIIQNAYFFVEINSLS